MIGMEMLLYLVLFLLSVVCILWLFICICISCRNCLEQYEETWWACYVAATKKRAVEVHPIEATEVTYIGEVNIENG